MTQYGIPGGTVAVAYNGNIVYSRGYGFANANTGFQMQPDTLFRVASLSKAITSAAILMLSDAGKLNLDDQAYAYLSSDLVGTTLTDSRIKNITIRQLMHHTSGIDDMISGQPFGQTYSSGNSLWKSCRDVIVHDLPNRALSFNPGTQFQYTDYGFCMLSRIIENVSGYTYEQFVSRNIFSPLGVATAHAGDTLSDTSGMPESYYHDKPGVGLVAPLPGIFPGIAPPQVARPYGAYYLEGYSGSAVWVMSATDYLRFMLGYRGMRQPTLLSAATQSLIYEQPAPPVPQVTNSTDSSTDYWYGLGLYVRQNGTSYNTWHDGWLYGVRSYNVAYSTGIAWVTLFNSTPETNYTDVSPAITQLDDTVATALSNITNWPTADVVPPAPVPPQSGFWWNPGEPGTGYALEFRGGKLWLNSFLYATNGNPNWMMSSELMTTSTSYNGTLWQFLGGETLGSPYELLSTDRYLGVVSIAFSSPTTAVLTNPWGSVTIKRFDIIPGGVASGPAAAMPETGWWWDPQDGYRFFYAQVDNAYYMEVQGNSMYFTAFMYDQSGQPVWYVSNGQMTSPTYYLGSLVELKGGATTTSPDRTVTSSTNVGQIAIQFTGQQNAILTLPSGNQLTLTRYRY